jgi:hypothetical protein
LGDSRYGINENLRQKNHHWMDQPCTCIVDATAKLIISAGPNPTYNLHVPGHSPGALTHAAFSLTPTAIRSTSFSRSSPPTSVTVTKLPDLALPLPLLAPEPATGGPEDDIDDE